MSSDDSARPLYDRVFWVTYVSNLTCVTINAATFRFAELVDFLGGTEQTAGTIVAVGGVAAFAGRFVLGPSLDRYGVGRVWRVMAVALLLGTLGFWLLRELGWPMTLARALFAIGLAGGFTGSNLHMMNYAPPGRGTEAIGTLGTSGFLGLILGTQVGDRLFFDPASPASYDAVFGFAAAASAFYVVVVFGLTSGLKHVRPAENPPLHRLMAEHQPLGATAVALVMGGVFAVTQVFLTRFATHLGIADIGTFFMGYACSAFGFRLLTRKLSQRVGRHRMLVVGLGGYVVGFAVLMAVTTEWGFVFPAVCIGFGHAMLFPSVVSLISESFPPAYRGSGTNSALGTMEFGTLASAPLLGAMIDGLPYGYEAVFGTLVGCSGAVLVAYALTSWRTFDPESQVVIPVVRAEPKQHEPEGAGRVVEPCTN